MAICDFSRRNNHSGIEWFGVKRILKIIIVIMIIIKIITVMDVKRNKSLKSPLISSLT